MKTSTVTTAGNQMGRKLQRQLRREEAEQTKSNMSYFDLQIKLQQLEKVVRESKNQARRVSLRAIDTEHFYSDEENSAAATPLAPVSRYDFDHNVPTVKPPSRNSYENSDAAPGRSGGREGRPSQSSAPLSSHISRRMYEEELSEVMNRREELERQLTEQIIKTSKLEAIVGELRAEAVAAEDVRIQEIRHLESVHQQLENEAKNKAHAFEQESSLRVAAERQASAAEARALELSAKHKRAAALLDAERRRMEEWERSRKKEFGPTISVLANSGELDSLLRDLDAQRYKLENAKYSKTWREEVMHNMDLCLRILYACEREVVERRMIFAQRSCGVEPKAAAEGTSPIAAS